MLVKIFTNIQTSPTYILHQQKHFSPTYRKIFTNIIHQHTYNFEWADFSLTCYFTNIIFTNIMLIRRWMLVKVIHQHTCFSATCIFHQHPSPTLEQSAFDVAEWSLVMLFSDLQNDLAVGIVTRVHNYKISQLSDFWPIFKLSQ